jgi:hypothetical protein
MFPLLLALTGAPAADPVPKMPQPEQPGDVKTHCPTWNHYFAPGRCADHGMYPFQMQPRVCPVAVCSCYPRPDDPNNRACQPWVKEFSEAAFIPYPRFDLEGRCVPGEGLLIYEGMRLVVDPATGQYDLTFTATVPRMPVNLRLQLEFTNPADHGDQYRLTLPAIRLEPRRDARPGDPTPWTFQVAHRGYSTLFQELERRTNVHVPQSARAPALIDPRWSLRRDGAARFGTPVAIEDPNR